jgi:hypothetical protein
MSHSGLCRSRWAIADPPHTGVTKVTYKMAGTEDASWRPSLLFDNAVGECDDDVAEVVATLHVRRDHRGMGIGLGVPRD